MIRCYSTATDIISWANLHGYFQYNLMDLDEDDEKFLYTIENEQVTINNYIGDEENVEIPSQIEGYPVTKVEKIIGTYKNLTIPSTVKEIGINGVIYSPNLESINVDDENQYFTSKNGIMFDKSESKIIFYPMGRQETSYEIPEGINEIYTYAFNGNMYLESIYIPKSVIKIDELNMNNLSKILVDEDNQVYKSKDNVLYKISDNEVEIVAIPRNIEGNVKLLYGLTNVGTYNFSNKNNLESVVIPTTVTSISNNAFEHCNNLKKIVISESTTELSEINSENLIIRDLSEDFKIYCEDGSIAQEYAQKWGIDYEFIEVQSIEIKEYPQKLLYIKNQETLELQGGLITITYDDGTSLDLSMESDLLNIQGFDNSSLGENEIEIEYKGKKEKFTVNIIEGRKITEITVTTAPTKTNYTEGQDFDKTGMVVTATYNDGSTKIVTDYTVTDGNNLAAGKTNVTISYTEDGVTKTATQKITVNEKLKVDINTYEEKKEGETRYIRDIKPSTSVKEVLEKIETNGTIEIYKEAEKITNTNANIGTGMKIRVTLNNEYLEYIAVVTGDLNGDGEMGDIDVLRMARYKAGLDNKLDGAYLQATDIHKDNNYANDTDLLKMARVLVGLDSL